MLISIPDSERLTGNYSSDMLHSPDMLNQPVITSTSIMIAHEQRINVTHKLSPKYSEPNPPNAG